MSYFVEAEGIYRCLPWDEFVWQKHGFGSRHANPVASVTLRQVHSDQVFQADELADRQLAGDALFTDLPGRSIGVRTADCVPLLLLDSRRRAVAAIHAGWRGTAAQISLRTLEKLSECYATEPADVFVAIGPSIRACCYRVGIDVASQFTRWLPNVRENCHVDLPRANRSQLEAVGVPADQIFDCDLCTSCLAEQFFSYRREPQNPGRMLSAIERI